MLFSWAPIRNFLWCFYRLLMKECNILQIILVQGFCLVKIKITQFPGGFRFNVCQLEYVICLSSQSIICRCSFSYYSVTYTPTKSNCTATTTLHCRKIWQECEYSTSCIIAFSVWLLLALINILRCFLNFCAPQASLFVLSKRYDWF